jgi:hypothetical protein
LLHMAMIFFLSMQGIWQWGVCVKETIGYWKG